MTASQSPADMSAFTPVRPRRLVTLAHTVILVALVAALWAPRLQGPIDLRWDAGVYYILGTSLYEGKGYRLLNEPGLPQALQYPPLLPAIVAAHEWLVGDARPAVAGQLLRWMMAALTLAYVLASYAAARWWLGPGAALAAGVLVAANAWVLFMSDVCFAEIPFGLASLGFLAITRSGNRWAHEAAAGTVGVACYLLRTLGLALLAAWVLEALVRRRYARAAFRAAVAAIPVLAWQGYVSHVRQGPEYARPAYAYQRAPYLMYNVSYFENMSLLDPFDPARGNASPVRVAKRTVKHFLNIPAILGQVVSAQQGAWRSLRLRAEPLMGRRLARLAEVPPLVLGMLVLVGLAVLASRGEALVVLFLGATFGMICVSPWLDQFVRYLTPLASLMVPALLLGLSAVHEHVRRRGRIWARTATAGTLALLLGLAASVAHGMVSMIGEKAGFAPYTDRHGEPQRQRLFFYNDQWAGFDSALAWLARSADPTEVVATTAPHWTSLRSGVKAVQPPYEDDPGTAQRFLDSVPVSYVIVDGFDYSGGNLSRRYAAPAIREHPTLWQLAYETPRGDVRVYRRVRSGQP